MTPPRLFGGTNLVTMSIQLLLRTSPSSTGAAALVVNCSLVGTGVEVGSINDGSKKETPNVGLEPTTTRLRVWCSAD
jgi:hypothetical protein